MGSKLCAGTCGLDCEVEDTSITTIFGMVKCKNCGCHCFEVTEEEEKQIEHAVGAIEVARSATLGDIEHMIEEAIIKVLTPLGKTRTLVGLSVPPAEMVQTIEEIVIGDTFRQTVLNDA